MNKKNNPPFDINDVYDTVGYKFMQLEEINKAFFRKQRERERERNRRKDNENAEKRADSI